MAATKHSISILLLGLLAGACGLEKPLELEALDPPTQLQLQAFLSPQGGIEAYVGAVLPPLEVEEDPTVTGVAVAVYRDGTFWAELEAQSATQFALPNSLAVEEGVNYHLEVTAPGYPTLTSEAIDLLPEVTLDSITWLDETDSTAQGIYLSFRDPEGIANYYYWSEAVWENGRVIRGEAPGYFRLTRIYHDQNWDGQLYVERDLYNIIPTTDSVQFAFYHLSPIVYQYFKEIERMGFDQGNPFATPPILPSNVTGGVGFFGSVTYQHLLLREF